MKGSLGASERIRQVLGVLVLAGVAAIALGLDTRVLAKLSSDADREPRNQHRAQARPRRDRRRQRGEDRRWRAADAAGRRRSCRRSTGSARGSTAPPLTREQLKRQGRADRLLDLQLHQLPALDPVRPRVARALCQATGWSSSASTRPSSRSSAIRTMCARRSPTSASATRSRSTTSYSAVDARSRTITGRRTTSSMPRGACATTISARADYAQSERVIRQLLAEAGRAPKDGAHGASAMTRGAEAAAAIASIKSPETYIGYWRAERFVSPGGLVRDAAQGLRGGAARSSTTGRSKAIGRSAARARARTRPARAIPYRFHARDLHLVLASRGRAGAVPA